MSSSASIHVHQVGKKYWISGSSETPTRKSLKGSLHSFLSGGLRKQKQQELWALKDLSFDLHPGEIVSIMGRNGSGKSTLLKLLARVTPPSEGEIHLQGRLGALLEVGTGMHPDLSGRDNIYFCAALLGVSRKEVVKKLDAIVDFANISDFLDTPLKKYSSGMALRLACAVLFHLETDLLILDEVLTVGDYAFQNLCFEKIQQVAKEGRIILCVAHHEEWISKYCHRALLLKKGRLISDGKPAEVLQHYHLLGETP